MYTRFSNVGEKVLDPYGCMELFTFISAAVGREWLGFYTELTELNRCKAKLEDIKDIIAAL